MDHPYSLGIDLITFTHRSASETIRVKIINVFQDGGSVYLLQRHWTEEYLKYRAASIFPINALY